MTVYPDELSPEYENAEAKNELAEILTGFEEQEYKRKNLSKALLNKTISGLRMTETWPPMLQLLDNDGKPFMQVFVDNIYDEDGMLFVDDVR